MSLDKKEIVRAGLALLNEVGLDGLSTRKLALVLCVQGPALYHHFQNKHELLGYMSNALISEALDGLDPRQGWEEWLRRSAISIRAVVLSYRDGARLLTTAWPDDDMRHKTIPMLVSPLLRAGFAMSDAQEAIVIMSSFSIGWMMNEQNHSLNALMASQMNIDAAYVRALDAIILGLRARLPG